MAPFVENRDVGERGARRERGDHLVDRLAVAVGEGLVDDLGEHRRERDRLRADLVLAAAPLAPERVGRDRDGGHEHDRDRQHLDLGQQAEPHRRQADRRDGVRRQRLAVAARAPKQPAGGAGAACVSRGRIGHRRVTGSRAAGGAARGDGRASDRASRVRGLGRGTGRRAAARAGRPSSRPGSGHRSNAHAIAPERAPGQAAVTGILPIRARHSRGPVSCTDVPFASTATVTGMSRTSNS